MKQLALSVITLLLLASHFGLANAQFDNEQIGFTINPAIVEISADTEKKTTHSFLVETTSLSPVPVTIESKSLIPIDNIIDLERREEFDASKWIDIKEANYILEPNKPIEISFDVTVPDNATPGGHYATIAITKLDILDPQSNLGPSIIPEIGVNVFINVPGEVVEKAELDTAGLARSYIARSNETKFELGVLNRGNVHFTASPTLTIRDGEKLIEKIVLPPQLILPNTVKSFDALWDADASFGKYQIEAELVYGNTSTLLKSQPTELWVGPNIAQLLGLLLVAVFILTLIIKWRNVPRMINVLRGRATFGVAQYKGHSGADDLPKVGKDTQSISEIAREIEQTPNILGLQDTTDESFCEENKRETHESIDPPKSKPQVKPEIISQTRVTDQDKVTYITQTSGSTIVRESSPFYTPEKETVSEPKKIAVLHHDELVSKPTETTKPAPAAKKKAPTKKKAQTKQVKSKGAKVVKNKATAKKTTSKAPPKSKKSAPKTSAKKKPSTGKSKLAK